MLAHMTMMCRHSFGIKGNGELWSRGHCVYPAYFRSHIFIYLVQWPTAFLLSSPPLVDRVTVRITVSHRVCVPLFVPLHGMEKLRHLTGCSTVRPCDSICTFPLVWPCPSLSAPLQTWPPLSAALAPSPPTATPISVLPPVHTVIPLLRSLRGQLPQGLPGTPGCRVQEENQEHQPWSATDTPGQVFQLPSAC